MDAEKLRVADLLAKFGRETGDLAVTMGAGLAGGEGVGGSGGLFEEGIHGIYDL